MKVDIQSPQETRKDEIVGLVQVDGVVQGSYLIVFRRVGELRNPAAFVPWLSRIVLHVCYRLKKKQTPTEEVPEMVAPGDHSQEVLDSMVLRKALSQLHQRDRDVLILHEMVALPHPQIAYALRIPEGTARSRLFAARRRLKQVLEQQD